MIYGVALFNPDRIPGHTPHFCSGKSSNHPLLFFQIVRQPDVICIQGGDIGEVECRIAKFLAAETPLFGWSRILILLSVSLAARSLLRSVDPSLTTIMSKSEIV